MDGWVDVCTLEAAGREDVRHVVHAYLVKMARNGPSAAASARLASGPQSVSMGGNADLVAAAAAGGGGVAVVAAAAGGSRRRVGDEDDSRRCCRDGGGLVLPAGE